MKILTILPLLISLSLTLFWSRSLIRSWKEMDAPSPERTRYSRPLILALANVLLLTTAQQFVVSLQQLHFLSEAAFVRIIAWMFVLGLPLLVLFAVISFADWQIKRTRQQARDVLARLLQIASVQDIMPVDYHAVTLLTLVAYLAGAFGWWHITLAMAAVICGHLAEWEISYAYTDHTNQRIVKSGLILGYGMLAYHLVPWWLQLLNSAIHGPIY